MSVERQAASGLKWSSTAKLAGQAISWAITLLVLRLLVPADYGLMALSTVVISITVGVAELGLGSALVQAKSVSHRDLRRVAGALFALNLACGAIVALAAPLFAHAFAEPRVTPLIRLASLQFVFNALSAVPVSLAYRDMRFKQMAVIDLTTLVTGSLVTLLLAWSGAGVWALLIGTLTSAGLRTVLFLMLGTSVWPSFDFRGIGSHLRFGGAMTGAQLLWQFTYQTDLLVAGRMLAAEATGIYSVAVYLANLPMQKAMSIVNQVAFPTIARLQAEPERLKARLLDGIRLLGFVAIPALWGIAAVAPEFVPVVLGAKWHAAIVPLQIVSLVAPLRMLGSVLATAVSAVGRADVELRNTIIGAAVLPLAFIAGAHWWGIEGLAAAWVVAVPLLFVINFPRTARPLGLSLREIGSALQGPLLAGAAMYAAVAGARLLLIAQHDALRLPILIAIGVAAYLGMVTRLDRTLWLDVKRMALAARG